jgi:hypothetical protein
MEKSNSRMNILSRVVTSEGKFDDDKCQQLLGDYYDNFIEFCNHLKILNDVERVSLTEFNHTAHKAKFNIETKDGRLIEIER